MEKKEPKNKKNGGLMVKLGEGITYVVLHGLGCFFLQNAWKDQGFHLVYKKLYKKKG